MTANYQAQSVMLLPTNDSLILYASTETKYPGVTKLGETMALYNASSQQWGSVSISGEDIKQEQDYHFDLGVSDPVSGFSFYISTYYGFQQLLKTDLSNANNLSWIVESARGRSTQFVIPRISGGRMVYLPLEKAGILLFIGGLDQIDGPSDVIRSMDIIYVYDIDSSIWFNVTATGTPKLPPGRVDFCLASSQAPDDSSFQVTLHGGNDPISRQYFDDVWTVSVPSFRWIAVNATNNDERKNDGTAGRGGHTCSMWQQSQMLVLGGSYATDVAPGDNRNSECAPVRLLDTSTYSWRTQFIPNDIEYKVPSVVYDLIGGGASGKSTLTSPQGGWVDPELSDIFSRRLSPVKNIQSTSTPKPTTSSVTAGPSSTATTITPFAGSSRPDNPNNKTGSIAGGVIAGVLAFLIALAWFLYRRRQKRRAETSKKAYLDTEPDAVTWSKAELGNNLRYELAGASKPLPELPEERRVAGELPSEYIGSEMRDTSQRAWLRFGSRSEPVELSSSLEPSELPS